MLRNTLAIALVLAVTASARAQIRVAETSIDLGEIRAGQPASCRFRFDNVGAAAVELVDLERGCGCQMAVWNEKRIESGRAGSIEMKFRTLGQPEGRRTWNATLLYRVGSEIHRQPLIVAATIRNELVLEPSQVAITVQKSIEQEIVLVDHRERPLKVVEATTKAAGVGVSTKSAPGRTTIRLAIDGEAMMSGRHDEILTIRTDDPTYPELEVPITLTRVEKPAATWSPEVPEVVLAPGQKQGSVLVQVRSEKPLAIRGAEGSEPGLTCTWGAGETGATLRIRVDRSTFRGRGLVAYVHLTTDGTPISIPVFVRME